MNNELLDTPNHTYSTYNSKRSGFTIVELLIVIIVVGILAATTVVAFNGVNGRAKFSKVNSELRAMQKLVEMYKVDNGNYPLNGATNTYQRIDGNNFIPGIVPAYASSLPKVTDTPVGWVGNDTYIYGTNATGSGYYIQRLYQPEVLASEWANVPSSMKQGASLDRYGVGKNLGGY